MAAPPRPYLSPEEYLALERRAETKHEYYDGVLVAMVEGTGTDSQISGNTIIAFGAQLRGRPCTVFTSDLKVGITKLSAYAYPDVTIVCGRPQYADAVEDVLVDPLVIVEVLSPSTEHYDRTGKFLRYQRIPSFAEYLLIAQDRPLVELCSRQDDGMWEWVAVEGLAATIAIPSLGCTLALADIYNYVSFDRA